MPATIVEITMRGSVPKSNGSEEIVSNVFHYSCEAGAGTLVPANVIAIFDTTVCAFIGPLLSVEYTALATTFRNLMSPLNPVVEGALGTDGAVTGDRLPLNTAATVRLRCADRGKRFRGSKHFAPISEDDTLLDELKAATLATWTTQCAQFIASLTDANGNLWVPIVLSRTYSNLTALTPSFVYSRITSATINKIIGTMRRRRERVAS